MKVDLTKKRQIEKLLKRRGYTQDTRPDHREWWKLTTAFNTQIRLDQNNPGGFNGFQAQITTYMRWDVQPKHIETLLRFLKERF